MTESNQVQIWNKNRTRIYADREPVLGETMNGVVYQFYPYFDYNLMLASNSTLRNCLQNRLVLEYSSN